MHNHEKNITCIYKDMVHITKLALKKVHYT
jgi:hypothetical protein